MSLKLNNNGDTIVEVLIAITVVSLILAGGFVSARRNLNTTQQAKERDQGGRLVESQVERLKAAATSLDSTSNNIHTRNPGYFCLDNNLTPYNLGGAVPSDMNADTFGAAQYPPQCVLDSSNTQYAAATAPSTPYYMSIQRHPTEPNLFTVRARWQRIGGQGREEAIALYRVYQ